MGALIYLMIKLCVWTVKATILMTAAMCWLMFALIALPFTRGRGINRSLGQFRRFARGLI